MAISQKRYIAITSGVGGNSAAKERELIARLLTSNSDAPLGPVLEFSSLDSVGNYFGTSSDEYKWAEKYFGFISKDIVQPKKISFARWARTQTTAYVKSTQASQTLADYKHNWGDEGYDFATVTIGGYTAGIDVDLSSATSLTNVAELIEAEINSKTDGGLAWTSATLEYINNQFVLTSGSPGGGEITLKKSGHIMSAELCWADVMGLTASKNPISSIGSAVETPAAAIARVANISNNFGSFAFIDALTPAEIGGVASWNNAQNFLYLYSVGVTPSNASEVHTAVDGMNGTCLTLTTDNGKEEYMPCAILAATDYTRYNATQNYMFQQFDGAVSSVTTDANADLYDALKVNYYGQTQSAGQKLAFYQRGVLQGSTGDIGVFCNEMWLKDSFIVAFFNLLIAVTKVPANIAGIGMVRGVMQNTINTALANGTIIPQKALNVTQKAYISQVTGDPEAWFTVYDKGYWLKVNVTEEQISGTTNYKINYLLVYSKGDAIKKVEGTHILI